ncbi:MAG: hypothetical protein SFV21_03680 [Rhodospirillaceae bacterium]|nr:hypothetical protein [Rhodospirillaceae bacterium]
MDHHPPTGLLGNHPAIRESEWPAIRDAYAEPQRHYHTWAHIVAVLAAAEPFAAVLARPRGMYLACVFHDIVYVPGAADNEIRSAEWLRSAQARGGIDADAADLTAALALIEASGGEGVAGLDGDAFWDIDRAILAAPADDYAAYARAVRREFARFGDFKYRLGRRRFLHGELARPHIFRTADYRRNAEGQARANLAAERDDLGRGGWLGMLFTRSTYMDQA